MHLEGRMAPSFQHNWNKSSVFCCLVDGRTQAGLAIYLCFELLKLKTLNLVKTHSSNAGPRGSHHGRRCTGRSGPWPAFDAVWAESMVVGGRLLRGKREGGPGPHHL